MMSLPSSRWQSDRGASAVPIVHVIEVKRSPESFYKCLMESEALATCFLLRHHHHPSPYRLDKATAVFGGCCLPFVRLTVSVTAQLTSPGVLFAVSVTALLAG